MPFASAGRITPLATAQPPCIHIPAPKHNPKGAGLLLALLVIPSEATSEKVPLILGTTSRSAAASSRLFAKPPEGRHGVFHPSSSPEERNDVSPGWPLPSSFSVSCGMRIMRPPHGRSRALLPPRRGHQHHGQRRARRGGRSGGHRGDTEGHRGGTGRAPGLGRPRPAAGPGCGR